MKRLANLGENQRFLILVLVIAVLATAILTFPLVRDWRTSVPGGEVSDAINYAWSFWWFEKALFEIKQSPMDMDLIYYPIGAYHPKEMASIFPKIISVPLITLLNTDPFVIYNLHLFIATVLTILFMAWLCFDMTGSKAAGIIGGLIFSFGANRITHILSGHFTQSLTFFFPLLVLSILWMWRKPTLFRGLLFGAVLGMSASVDLMPLVIFVGPIFATLFLFLLVSDRKRFLSKPFLTSLLPGLLLAALLIIPFYYPLISAASSGELDWYKGSGIVEFSADALAFIIPTPENPLVRWLPFLRELSKEIYTFRSSRLEGTVFLGWMTLFLAVTGVIKYWEKGAYIKYWFTVAFAAVLLAIGPWLRFKGKIIEIAGRPLIMPYALFLYLPFMSWGRTPGRFGLTALFALSILAAYGTAYWSGRIQNRTFKALLLGGFTAFIVIESLTVYPWPMNDRYTPDFYESVREDERQVAVLDLPVVGYVPAKIYMLYQMEHGHAIVGGWRDRRSQEVEAEMLAFEALAAPGGDIQALADAGIGYIVLHKNYMSDEKLFEFKQHINREVGSAEYEDETILAFQLEDVSLTAPQPVK